MRLNKYISHHSCYSRREADALIESGKVSINKSTIFDFSYQVHDEKVFVNGRALKPKESYSILVYNKPKGEIVSKRDERGRRVIFDSIPKRFHHFIHIGRLDFGSEGLLLLCDSPKIAHFLMHGDFEREYLIKLSGPLSTKVFEAMEQGMSLDDATKGAHPKTNTKAMDFKPFERYEVIKNKNYSKIKVAIKEGKNRELRRFFGHFDLEVLDLKRVSYGFIHLNNLPTQKFRYCSRQEYNKLRKLLAND